MTFVKLTKLDELKVTVNFQWVVSLKEKSSGCFGKHTEIGQKGDKPSDPYTIVYVKESIEEILKASRI